MSSERQSNNVLPVLLFLAVLGLGGWNAWLTLENQKLKQAMGGGAEPANSSELAERVDALEASMEDGLVLSIINPSRGDTVLSAPIRAVSKGGGSKSGTSRQAKGRDDILPSNPDNGALFPEALPEEADPSEPFDFSTGGNDPQPGFPDDGFPQDPRDPGKTGFNDILNGSDPSLIDPENDNGFGPDFSPEEGLSPRPEGDNMTAREPGPTSGTFGESQTLVGGTGDEPYLFEMKVESLLNPSFISIDGGSASGVRPGARFLVLRGKKEIGKVTVQEVRQRTSIAEINEFVGGYTIQQGDRLVPE